MSVIKNIGCFVISAITSGCIFHKMATTNHRYMISKGINDKCCWWDTRNEKIKEEQKRSLWNKVFSDDEEDV